MSYPVFVLPRDKIWLAASGALVLAAAAAYFAAVPPVGAAIEGKPAPPLVLADLSGQTASLAEYRGKIVLLDFWATWCVTCLEELPELKRLYSALAPRGFELLAPSVDEEGRKALLPFVAKHGVPWRVLLADRPSLRLYPVFGLPTKYLIDREGIVSRKYIGPVPVSSIENDVQSLLQRRSS